MRLVDGRPARCVISYAAERRAAPPCAIYARHVASHHTSDGINLHRAPPTAPTGPSYPPSRFRTISLSLSFPSGELHPSLSHLSEETVRFYGGVKIRQSQRELIVRNG